MEKFHPYLVRPDRHTTMLYHYKKPFGRTWTRHVTDSLEADVAAGRIGADWRIRRDGEFTDYLPRDLLAAEAAGRAMSEIVYLKAACEHCSGRVEYPSELAGQSIECPHCHKAMPLPPLIPSSKVERDAITSLAIKSLKELVTRFPTRSIRKFTNTPYDIMDVSIDAKKTDSLIYPVIGMINFTTDEAVRRGRIQLHLQMVFDWQGDHWTFARLLNRENGIDFTHRGGGKEILGAGPMSDFLKSLQ